MGSAESVDQADRCGACAGFGWVYVTAKLSLATGGERGARAGRSRRACRVCGDPSVDLDGAAS
ncbi:hypothetical protein GCM10010399_85740 [Dactylosporangium fulvum]